MEQNSTNKVTKKPAKKTDSQAIRFDKAFMKQVSKLVDKANKKQFGRKVKPKAILTNLFSLADDALIDKAIQKAQEDSLSHNDKRELFLKEHMAKFNGSKEQFEEKMMELMSGFLSQNPV